MFGLLVDKGWIRERSGTPSRCEKRRRFPAYIACVLACGLLVIGGVWLASNDVGRHSDPAPVPKARIRLM
jgi:hypothetical protein